MFDYIFVKYKELNKKFKFDPIKKDDVETEKKQKKTKKVDLILWVVSFLYHVGSFVCMLSNKTNKQAVFHYYFSLLPFFCTTVWFWYSSRRMVRKEYKFYKSKDIMRIKKIRDELDIDSSKLKIDTLISMCQERIERRRSNINRVLVTIGAFFSFIVAPIIVEMIIVELAKGNFNVFLEKIVFLVYLFILIVLIRITYNNIEKFLIMNSLYRFKQDLEIMRDMEPKPSKPIPRHCWKRKK